MSLQLDRRPNYGPQPLDHLIRESLHHDFYQPSSDSDMSIGIIHYREQVGTMTTRTTEIVRPHHAFSLDGIDLQEGEFTEEHEENLYRVTSLHVYPHPLAASVAHQYANMVLDTDRYSDLFVDTDLIGIRTHLTSQLLAKLREYNQTQRADRRALP